MCFLVLAFWCFQSSPGSLQSRGCRWADAGWGVFQFCNFIFNPWPHLSFCCFPLWDAVSAGHVVSSSALSGYSVCWPCSLYLLSSLDTVSTGYAASLAAVFCSAFLYSSKHLRPLTFKEKGLFGSQSVKFQYIINWPCCLWAWYEAVHCAGSV